MSQSEKFFANNLLQLYQDVGQLHGADAQKLLRESLDGLYHEAVVTSMLATVDMADAENDADDRQEYSRMLDDFVETGADAEAILENIAPFCARDGLHSVSQVIQRYLDQQKTLLSEVGDMAEQQRFRERYRTLVDRANRNFGALLEIKAKNRLKRRSPEYGEA